MAPDVNRLSREGALDIIDGLCEWAPRHAAVTGLHAGDVGWHLRLDDADVADTLVTVHDGGELVAVAIMEGEMIRPAIKPSHWDDRDVAAALGELTQSLPTTATGYIDAAAHLAYRGWLSSRGWTVDPGPWAALYRPLTALDGEYDDPS